MDNFGQMLGESLADVDLSSPINLAHPLARGLVGFWLPLPSLSGGMKLYDLSRYRNHGTLSNMDPRTDWVNTERGIALDFDGTDTSVVGANFGITSSTQYTIIGIARKEGAFPTGYGTLANVGGATRYAQIYLLATNTTLYNFSHVYAALPSGWDDGDFHFFACTKPSGSSPGAESLFFDGLRLAASYTTDAYSSADTALRFGASSAIDHEWNGSILAIALFFSVLADEEIRNFYLESLRGFPTLLNRRRRWWPVSASVPPSQTILDYERGFARGFSRGYRVGAL